MTARHPLDQIEQARREKENGAFHEWWEASGHADDPIFTLTMENCAHAAWQARATAAEATVTALQEALKKAADVLEQAETDRAEQWRLRRDAEGSRDAARAAADSLRIERDMMRTAISDILEGWDFWQVNPHDREPPRDAIRRARTALTTIRRTTP